MGEQVREFARPPSLTQCSVWHPCCQLTTGSHKGGQNYLIWHVCPHRLSRFPPSLFPAITASSGTKWRRLVAACRRYGKTRAREAHTTIADQFRGSQANNTIEPKQGEAWRVSFSTHTSLLLLPLFVSLERVVTAREFARFPACSITFLQLGTLLVLPREGFRYFISPLHTRYWKFTIYQFSFNRKNHSTINISERNRVSGQSARVW